MKGCVFDIQRFSIHDGPGVRTTVFLKGCPLRCKWCCNPEAFNPKPELLFNPDLCIKCGQCLKVCPSGAITGLEPNRLLCKGCGACAEVCYAEALYMKGRYLTPDEIISEAMKDMLFYSRTGGGVTFSGGEPLTQIDFLEETLSLCRDNNLNTAIETCGYVPWEHFERIAPLTDVFLYDIKSTDATKHKEYTGVDCGLILENCARLSKIAKQLVIRVPVIPMFNFDREALLKIVTFAEEIGVKRVDFLPYHRMAANKYRFLGAWYWNPGVPRLDVSDVSACINEIETPLKLRIGG